MANENEPKSGGDGGSARTSLGDVPLTSEPGGSANIISKAESNDIFRNFFNKEKKRRAVRGKSPHGPHTGAIKR